MRVEAFDIVQRRAHVVSDQEIVKQFVFDAGHQRVARALEADPDITFIAIEVDYHARSARRYFNKPEIVTQSLTSREVAADLGFVVAGQGVGPAVAEIFRLSYDPRGAPRVDWRDLVGFAIDPDEGGKDFRPVWDRVGLVIRKLWN